MIGRAGRPGLIGLAARMVVVAGTSNRQRPAVLSEDKFAAAKAKLLT